MKNMIAMFKKFYKDYPGVFVGIGWGGMMVLAYEFTRVAS